MAKFGNRVKQTFDSTGTGTVDLNATVPTGFNGFADEFSDGDEVYYLMVDDPDSPTDFEYGVGTFSAGTPDTLSRDTVEGSSNGGSKVSWASGTKTVIATPTAAALGGQGPLGGAVNAQALPYTVTALDRGKLVKVTGTDTLSLPAAAAAGSGFRFAFRNGGSGIATIDPDSSETIDGFATLKAWPGEAFEVVCDGSGWTTAGRAAVVLVAQGAVSAAATLDLTNLDASFADFELHFDDLLPATDNVTLYARTSTDNGSSFTSSAASYGYARLSFAVGGSAVGSGSNGDTEIEILANQGNGAGEEAAGRIAFRNPLGTGAKTRLSWEIDYVSATGNEVAIRGGGARAAAEANNAIRLAYDSGNIATMNYRLYGRRAQMRA